VGVLSLVVCGPHCLVVMMAQENEKAKVQAVKA